MYQSSMYVPRVVTCVFLVTCYQVLSFQSPLFLCCSSPWPSCTPIWVYFGSPSSAANTVIRDTVACNAVNLLSLLHTCPLTLPQGVSCYTITFHRAPSSHASLPPLNNSSPSTFQVFRWSSSRLHLGLHSLVLHRQTVIKPVLSLFICLSIRLLSDGNCFPQAR